jgi:hypothetical protein
MSIRFAVFFFGGKGKAIPKNNSLTVGKQSLISGKSAFRQSQNVKKGVWDETTRHLLIDEMGIFYFFATRL